MSLLDGDCLNLLKGTVRGSPRPGLTAYDAGTAEYLQNLFAGAHGGACAQGHFPLCGGRGISGDYGAFRLRQNNPDEHYWMPGRSHLRSLLAGGGGHCRAGRLKNVGCAPAQHWLCVPKLLPAVQAVCPGQRGPAPAVCRGAPPGAPGNGAAGPGASRLWKYSSASTKRA